MSFRTIAGAAVTVAALTTPVAASARPADAVIRPTDGVGRAPAPLASGVSASTPPAGADAAAIPHGDGGAGTLTVLAVAGGTLLVGAATGFEGGRALTRRRALRP